MAPPPFLIDAHIHLWDADAVDKLAWCLPEHVLARRCAVEDYAAAVRNGKMAEEAEEAAWAKAIRSAGEPLPDAPAPVPVVGYIAVESDRVNGSGMDWTQPLAEVRYLRGIVEAEAKQAAEGTTKAPTRCLAIVPWAPLHGGLDVMEQYLAQVEEAAGPVAWPLVRGFRYLLQDKPAGTMLKRPFVDSLLLLGERKFVFELGVDHRRRGKAQMDELVKLVEEVHERVPEEERVVLVINHLAKPDLTVINPVTDRGFASWRNSMFALSKASPKHIYVKLSGLFSEMSPSLCTQPIDPIFSATFAWFAVLLASFGSSRLMFASDWPVCTTNFVPADTDTSKPADRALTAAETGSWDKWRQIVARMCFMATLNEESVANIWAGTAVRAYGLAAPMEEAGEEEGGR